MAKTSETKCLPEGLQLLNEWQNRLSISDWVIFLFDNVDPEEITIDDACASCDWSESTKEATIRMADPKKLKDFVRPWDYEVTLVHELLHCKFSLLDDLEKQDTLQSRVLHQILDDMARALVDAKRVGEKK